MTRTINGSVALFLMFFMGGEALAQPQLQFKTAIAGPYIQISNRYYVTGSLIAQIGAYGHKLNSSQGFAPEGIFSSAAPISATIVNFSGNTLNSMQGTFNINVPPFTATSFTGQNTSGTVTSMIATVWQMPLNQIRPFFNQLVASLISGPILANDDFRYMTGNIMVSQYQTTSTLSYSSQFSTTIDLATRGGTPGGTITATIGASGSNQQSVALSDNSIIGYQWNMVCWKNGAPVDFYPDSFSLLPTPTSLRPPACPGFKQSQGHQ
jgi:hypothetical protein